MDFGRVLVTGAGGFLGRYVMAELAGRCAVTGFDLRRPDGADDDFIAGDITDATAVTRAAAGCDAIVHIAAIANIWGGGGEAIMRVNAMGTWHVLQAAESAGVRRAVLCSSDSVVGFTVAAGRMIAPDYLPIDIAHPLRPTDPYALSKVLGERIGQSFAQRGMEVVCLRPVFVLYPDMEGEVTARARNPKGYRGGEGDGPNPAGGGPAWHHVDPRDAARAFRLALELRNVSFERFFVCGSRTLRHVPTLEHLRQHLGYLPEVRRPEIWRESPFAPLYDLSWARERLGFAAEFDLHHLTAPSA